MTGRKPKGGYVPYLMLILEQSGGRKRWSEAEGRSHFDDMHRYADALRARGVLVASESLRPDAQGVRVALRGGKRLLTEGPFAESKEVVGGFFLLRCDTREQALAIASECPATEWATVEVREVGPCWPPQ
jgi:hypothetical protein